MLPNVGLGELGIILLVVLVVMGPKRMPEVARALGKAYRTFQAESRKAQVILKEGFDEVDAVAKEARAIIDDPEQRPSHTHVAGPPPMPRAAAAPLSPPPGVVDLPDDLRTHEDT